MPLNVGGVQEKKSLEAEFGDEECAFFIGLARPGSAPLLSGLGLSRVWGLAQAPGLGGSRLV